MHSEKHENTHAAIIDQAIRVACKGGMEHIRFGELADSLGMSKSGIYGHFGSLGVLQKELVGAYCQRFEQQIFGSATTMSAGLPRLRSIFAAWCGQVGAGLWLDVPPSCGAADAGEAGALARQAWLRALGNWRRQLRACVNDAVLAGQLDADTDQAQLAHDIYGLIIALHHELRTFDNVAAVHRTARTFQVLLRLSGAARRGTDGEDLAHPDDKKVIGESWLAILGGPDREQERAPELADARQEGVYRQRYG